MEGVSHWTGETPVPLPFPMSKFVLRDFRAGWINEINRVPRSGPGAGDILALVDVPHAFHFEVGPWIAKL